MPESTPNKPKMLDMVIVTMVLVAIIAFLAISFNTRDLLWFWPVFEETPRQMIVHCYGSDVQVNPGPEFEAINTAVNDVLSGGKRWDQMTMSDETYQDYLSSPQMMALELVYNPAVRIHSFYSFYKKITQIIIPLDGRHANTNAVFGRLGEYSLSGSVHYESMAPILDAVESNGICQKP